MTDPIIAAAQFLLAQLDWCRHATDEQGEAYAVGVFAEIGDCAGRMRSLVNGREPGRYAGPCNSVDAEGKTCGRDVEARPGSNTGTCQACGARYDVDEQQAWMRSEIEDYLARPIEISGILLRLGFPIGYSTIAAYAAQGKIAAHGSDENGKPLFRIGDVMNIRIGK